MSSSSSGDGGGGDGGGGDGGGGLGGGERRANEAAIDERARFLDGLEQELRQPRGLSRETRAVKLTEHPETLELLRIAEKRWTGYVEALTQAEVDTIDDLVVWAQLAFQESAEELKQLKDARLGNAFINKLKDFYERYFPDKAQAHQAPDAKRVRTGK